MTHKNATHEHHSHNHDDHSCCGGHHHHIDVKAGNEKRVLAVAVLIGLFMFVEVAGGVISGSLALLADAAHMLTDFVSLLLAYAGFRIARKPADTKRSFGYSRFEILAAYSNGLLLLAIVAWIVFEAVMRVINPGPVIASTMLDVAVIGFIVNLVAFYILHKGDTGNLNMKGAIAHVLADLLGSVAAIVAAVVIHTTGYTPIDPILSVVVALLILKSAIFITRQSAHILIEGTPENFDLAAVVDSLKENVDGLENVHHVHVWSLTAEKPLITLHATIVDNASQADALDAIKACLADRFDLPHSVIQIEKSADCPDGENCVASAV